jgi:hypothetical protein
MQAHAIDTERHSSRRSLPKDPVEPTRLLSTGNKSPNSLVPILRSKAQANLVVGNTSERRMNMMIARPSVPRFITSESVNQVLSDAQFPDIALPDNPERRVSMAIVSTGRLDVRTTRGLIDGGANTGLINHSDLRLIRYATPARHVNITGIADSRVLNVRIGTFAAKVITQDGDSVILIFHEHGAIDNGTTILSKLQLEDGNCIIFDRPTQLNGEQHIICATPEGIDHVIPIIYHDGLPYLDLLYPTDEDMDTLPRMEMTRSRPWDPSIYDGPRNGPLSRSLSGEIRYRESREFLADIISRSRADTDTPTSILDDITRFQAWTVFHAIQDRENPYRGNLRMYGVRIPANREQALHFDAENGNTLWRDAEERAIMETFGDNQAIRETFEEDITSSPEYRHLRIFTLYMCKRDGTRKVRFVVDDPQYMDNPTGRTPDITTLIETTHSHHRNLGERVTNFYSRRREALLTDTLWTDGYPRDFNPFEESDHSVQDNDYPPMLVDRGANQGIVSPFALRLARSFHTGEMERRVRERRNEQYGNGNMYVDDWSIMENEDWDWPSLGDPDDENPPRVD